MSNRLTGGNALVGSLAADEDVTTGDDLVVGDDATVTGDLTAATLAVGGGSVIRKIATGTASVNLPSIAAGATGSATFTVTGAATTDAILVNPPALTSGLAFAGAAITSANTVTVYALNASAGAIDEAAATFRYVWIDFTA